MDKLSKIFVAGGTGRVGSSIVRLLKKKKFSNIHVASSNELDLRNQQQVKYFFSNNSFDYVFLAAAKVGGILANSTKKAEFIYDNLLIQSNVIHESFANKVKKLLFLGSSCIYPKNCDLPINENQLLNGELETTNDAYAVAKIAGIKLCESYREQYGFNAISAMPTNLYGFNDNFDLNSSHVIPALINKFINAKKNKAESVICWGTGKPLREFLYVDDLADSLFFLMNNYDESQHINVGTGKDISIYDLAYLIRDLTEYNGNIIWDKSKPDGTLRKVLDTSKINNLGWKYQTTLEKGLKKTIEWYEKNFDN